MAPESRQQSPAAIARRAERLEAKREIVLRATIDIINDGDVNPTMAKIVERSGIPERSVFRYFDDVADLTGQVLALAVRELPGLEPVGHDGSGSLTERIDELLAERITLLNRVRHLGRVSRLREGLSPRLAEVVDAVFAAFRSDMADRFAPELAAIDDDPVTLDTITALLSFEAFDLLSRRLGRSDDEIARQWRSGLRRLLG